MMNTLSERVDVLENAAARREEELRELESVSTERQDALLSVIASLEDRIVVLQDQLKIQSERTDTRPEQPVTPWRDCANAVNVVLLQSTTLEDGGLCVAVEAPAPSGSSSHSPCAEVVSPLAQAASPAPTTKDAMLVGARTSPDSRGKTADCHLGGKMCSRPAKGPQHDDHCADGARDCCESGKSPSDGSISFSRPYADAVRSETSRRGSGAGHGLSGGWRLVGSKKRHREERGLSGAECAHCTPCHLQGVNLDSTVEDILTYCRKRSVLVTGCYMIRTRVWGTQSAKLFVSRQHLDAVLSDSFWPDLIKCRKWELAAPTRPSPRN